MNALFASGLRLILPWVSRWATVDLRGAADLGALVVVLLLWAVLLDVLAFAACVVRVFDAECALVDLEWLAFFAVSARGSASMQMITAGASRFILGTSCFYGRILRHRMRRRQAKPIAPR